MLDATVATIKTIAENDPESTPEQIKSILGACKAPIARRKLITAGRAMEILEISRPTLREYARAGKLSEVRMSPRKVRFDLAEIERLAYNGAEMAR